MELKVGTDICSVKRIEQTYEKYGQKFLDKILTAGEVEYVLSRPAHRATTLAGRFAAKEAVSKALGTGWRTISWKDVEIVRHPSGAPNVVLHGRAKELAAKLGLTRFEVSVSHEKEFATAFVVAYSN